jgi:peroxin-10
MLECFGQQMLMKILENLQNTINAPDNNLKPQARSFLNIFLSKLRAILPTLIMIHRGLFYIFGKYYSIGRRLTGIEYVKVNIFLSSIISL